MMKLQCVGRYQVRAAGLGLLIAGIGMISGGGGEGGWLSAQAQVSTILITDGNAATDDTAHAGSSGVNAVSFRRNALYTVGDQQFAAYYDSDPDESGKYNVTIARRYLTETTWDIFHTNFVDEQSNAADGHNVISFGIDGDGIMHMAWGMHGFGLRYTESNGSVLGDGAISFQNKQAMTGTSESNVTYPEFYSLPDGDLLYMYRSGTSGNGDTLFKRFDTASDSWSTVQAPLYDGTVSGIPNNNAYFNRLGFHDDGSADGVLYATWTVRYNGSSPAGESGYQTNHNFYFAKSTDNGATWTKMDGTAYSTPINEGTAELVVSIPEGSSLINQADMTVDANGHPIIASWWAPETAGGNYNRQYMLAWYDGSDWQTSQITNRTSDAVKQDESQVRELARPIVVADDAGHVIVAMRYRDGEADDDVLKLAISSSPTRDDWTFIDLATGDLGNYEPVYDPVRWERDGVLSFLVLPISESSASATAPISVIEWDSHAYFGAPEPGTAIIAIAPMAWMVVRRRR